MLRLYRLLLFLYPARFREDYSAAMEREFLDEYREAPSAWHRAKLFLATLQDVLLSAPPQLARELWQDLRYSARVHAQRPISTLLAVASLSLAIGVTTGVFSVVNALLLRSLPFREPERIVQMNGFLPHGENAEAFHAWRKASQYLDDVAVTNNGEVSLTLGDAADRIRISESSANFFRLLGSPMYLGRDFADGEDSKGRTDVAVIGFGLWQQRFAGDPRALGSMLHVNGRRLKIVGIARPGFDYPNRAVLWTPTGFDWERIPKSDTSSYFRIARLRAGLSLDAARQMLLAEARAVDPKLTDGPEEWRPKLTSLRDDLAGPVRKASLALLAVVGFVLLIACANIANLLLSRVAERKQEWQVRSAFGASRARLIQQLITESIALALLATLAGMFIASWAARLALRYQPPTLDLQTYSVLDLRVVAFAFGLALLTGLIFGVLPAWSATRMGPGEDLVRLPASTQRAAQRRLRPILIAGQVALSFVLLAGSLAMGRGFLQLMRQDLGMAMRDVMTFTVSLAGATHDTESGRRNYYAQTLERLRQIPGVVAGGVEYVPMGPTTVSGGRFKMGSGREIPMSLVTMASTDYFRTLQIPLRVGRDFQANDSAGAPLIAIVNDEFVKFSGLTKEQILGRRFVSIYNKKEYTVIGVVGSIRQFGPQDEAIPQVYQALTQTPPGQLTFVARISGGSPAIAQRCREALQSLDRTVKVYNVLSFDERRDVMLARPRFYTTAILFFGAFALLLTIVGIHGVAAFAVAQRTHEIGVRLAVGATTPSVRGLLLRQSLAPIAVGLLVGLAGAWQFSRVMEHLMEGAEPVDVAVSAATLAALAAIAAFSIWLATQRVTRLDPIAILRRD